MALTKTQRVLRLQRVFLQQPDKAWKQVDLAHLLGDSEVNVGRDLVDLQDARFVAQHTDGTWRTTTETLHFFHRAISHWLAFQSQQLQNIVAMGEQKLGGFNGA